MPTSAAAFAWGDFNRIANVASGLEAAEWQPLPQIAGARTHAFLSQTHTTVYGRAGKRNFRAMACLVALPLFSPDKLKRQIPQMRMPSLRLVGHA
jgi:hypothetical protein